MTSRGTFIVNEVERVMISQLIRSPGVVFTVSMVRGLQLFGAKMIPNRGAWVEFETDFSGALYVKIDRKRKIAATALLQAFGMDEEKIRKAFRDIEKNSEVKYIEQ